MLQFLCNPGKKSLVVLESECFCRMSVNVCTVAFFKYSSLNTWICKPGFIRNPQIQTFGTSDLWWDLVINTPPPFFSIKADDCFATSSLAFPLLATNLPSDTVWIVWLFCFQQVYGSGTVPEEYYSHCPTAYQHNFIPLLAWDVSCVD